MKNTTSRRRTTIKSPEPSVAEAPAQAPAAPVSSLPFLPSPVGTIVVWKRYSETTGGPQVAVRFQMADPAFNREYVFDVPTAEAVADQISEVCDQHRQDFGAEWFTDQPTVQR